MIFSIFSIFGMPVLIMAYVNSATFKSVGKIFRDPLRIFRIPYV
jgi:hypothetical protein